MREESEFVKKLIVFIILIFSLSILSVSAASKPGEADIGFLQTLGVLTETDVDSGNDVLISRAEFLEKVLKLFKMNNLNSNEISTPVFSDVPEKHYYHKVIVDSYQLGIVSGYDNGTFQPDVPIDYIQAYRIVLNCLGYKDYLTFKGNSDSNYYSQADELNLTHKIKGVSNYTPLSKTDMFQLLFNTLHAKRFAVDFSNYSSGLVYHEGETVLESIYDIYFDEGIVEADYYISITGKIEQENKLRINNKVYNLSDTGLVGYNVRIYYQDDSGDYTGVYVIKKDNSEIELLHRDVVSFNDQYIEYAEQKGKAKKLSFQNTSTFICNGAILTSWEDIKTNVNKTATHIKAIDNDDDNKYDVIYIDNYTNIYLTQIDTTNKTIYGRNNERIIFDEVYEKYLIMDEKGSKLEFDALTKDSILSVCYPMNTKDTIYIYVSNKSDNLTIKGIGDEITDTEGIKYFVSESEVSDFDNLALGIKTLVYFDVYGDAAYFTEAEPAFMLGYVINIYPSDDYDGYEIKMLDKSNSIERHLLHDKVRMRLPDGTTTRESSEDVFNYMKTNSMTRIPIWYSKNADGKIKEIWFLTSRQDLKFHEVTDSVMFDDVTNGEYNSLFIYKGETMGFMAKLVFRNSSADVFVVPKDGTGYGGNSDYLVTTPSYFKTNNRFDCSATGNYKPIAISFKEDGFLTDALIWEVNFDGSINEYARGSVGIVTKISQEWDEKTDEVCYGLTIVGKNGTQTHEKFFASDDKIEDTYSRKIEPGDIICYGKDPGGYLKKGTVTICYDASDSKMYCTMIGQNYYRWDMNRISTAEVLSRDEDYVQVKLVKEFDGSGTSIECYPLKSSSVYSFDTQSKSLTTQTTNKVAKGDKFVALLSGGIKMDMIIYYE